MIACNRALLANLSTISSFKRLVQGCNLDSLSARQQKDKTSLVPISTSSASSSISWPSGASKHSVCRTTSQTSPQIRWMRSVNFLHWSRAFFVDLSSLAKYSGWDTMCLMWVIRIERVEIRSVEPYLKAIRCPCSEASPMACSKLPVAIISSFSVLEIKRSTIAKLLWCCSIGSTIT